MMTAIVLPHRPLITVQLKDESAPATDQAASFLLLLHTL